VVKWCQERGRELRDAWIAASSGREIDEGERDPAWSDTTIADAFEISVSKIQRLRQRLVEEGLAAALVRHPSPQRRPRKLDGAQEGGWWRWPAVRHRRAGARRILQLLADQLVVLQVVDTISDETVRITLKKMRPSPGVSASG
jgi:winged helix-turn helix protein